MALLSFRAVPRKGHLERAKRVVGYLLKMRHAILRFRTGKPDCSDVSDRVFEWTHTVYGGTKEILKDDAPQPKGPQVQLTYYVDANFMHCLMMEGSVTGIIHYANQTLLDWFTKKQNTVETATYGSEFMAACICVEQIYDIRNTLQYLGVAICEVSMMFGDNESVVNSSLLPHVKLHKQHAMLSFHKVQQAIAMGAIKFHFLDRSQNPADIVSKHWGYAAVWHLLQPMFFWAGDTADIPERGD